MSSEADYRLPRRAVPKRYEIALAPDLAAASFTGHEVVDLTLIEPTTEIVLNAAELEISDVEMIDSDGVRRVVASAIQLDEERERARFVFDEELERGEWKLLASFSGILNDDLRGFYRSTYHDDAGNRRVIATTQFEATDARRAFPCWDEPDLKATFAVTLEVAPGLVAISNGAEVSHEPTGDGAMRYIFAETMTMSTYLVAFIVGDLEITDPVDAGGVPLRVVHTPGKGRLADYALEVGVFALQYFGQYYEIPYPGDKLDLIAVPDFASGAMENLGAVTFRETALLIDKQRATRNELARVADVIAHELAHMWFGDLVTMKWWNGIWLNEAFATFMELKCVDAFRPDWNRWLTFAHFRAQSMDIDGLESTRPVEFPVASPEEADAMFDTLTYGKGSAVLRMLEQYLGEEMFRKGIVAYLKRHAYSNTDTNDLWAALEAVSGEPVGEMMEGWIYQGGYPQLDVTVADEGLRIEQCHFRFLGGGGSVWQVPALYRTGGEQRRVIIGDSAGITVPAEGFLLNSGGDGFYRVNYPDELRNDIARNFGTLVPAERYTLFADTWANVLAGETPAGEFVVLTRVLEGEDEPDIWGTGLAGLSELNRVISSDDRPALQRWVRSLLAGPVRELGWSPQPGEADRQRKLRALLLVAAGNLGDDRDVQAAARDLFGMLTAEGSEPDIDGDIADAAISIVAANGAMVEFEQLLRMKERAGNPQDEVRFLRAAAAVPQQESAERLIEMILAGEVRSQDSIWLAARLLGHRVTGPRVWKLVKDNWDAVLAAIPGQHKRRILDLIMYRSEPEIAEDIEAWLADHPIRGAGQSTTQQLERLQVRVGLRRREAGRLGEAFDL
ncbi:MAG: M1 family metallopeptidase [Acidimicrobiia bacterium]|nr:M1 family metallopeptidase [Acidimicrobiia bacterium]